MEAEVTKIYIPLSHKLIFSTYLQLPKEYFWFLVMLHTPKLSIELGNHCASFFMLYICYIYIRFSVLFLWDVYQGTWESCRKKVKSWLCQAGLVCVACDHLAKITHMVSRDVSWSRRRCRPVGCQECIDEMGAFDGPVVHMIWPLLS